MRDAFGSTFMFKLIIIFIVFYVSFMTIAFSYAKTFKVKNGVIDILEQYQYNSDDANSHALGVMHEYLESFTYIGLDLNNEAMLKKTCQGINYDNGNIYSNGVCIMRNSINETNDKVYYDVTVYLVISFPVFSQKFVIPIKGETSSIYLSY